MSFFCKYPRRSNLPLLCLARFFFLFFLAFESVVDLRAGEADDARRVWLTGYVKLEEAGKAENDRNYTLAIDLYRGARETFAKVRTRYPTWNPALLDYRMTYCEARVHRLEAALAANRNTLNRDQLLQLTRKLQEQLKAAAVQGIELKKKLEITSEALDRARAEAARGAAASENAAAVIAERDQLKQQLRTTQAKVNELTVQLQHTARNAGLEMKTRDLRQQRDLAVAAGKKLDDDLRAERDRRVKLETQNKALSTRYTQLITERRVWQKDLTDAKAGVAALTARNQELLGRLRDATVATTGLRKEVDAGQELLAQVRAQCTALKKEADKVPTLEKEVVDAAGERDRLGGKVQGLVAEAQRTAEALQNARRENVKLIEATNELETRIDGFKKERLDAKKNVAALRAGLETRLADAEARNEILEEERRQLTAQLTDAKTSLADLRAVGQKGGAQPAPAHGDGQLPGPETVAQLKAARRDLAAVRAELKTARDRIVEVTQGKDQLETENRENRKELDTRKEALDALRHDLAEEKKKNALAAADIETARERNRKLAANLAAASDKGRKLADALAKLQAVRAADRKDLETYKTQLDTLVPLPDKVAKTTALLDEKDALLTKLRKDLVERDAALKQVRDRLIAGDRHSLEQETTINQLQAQVKDLREQVAVARRNSAGSTLTSQVDDLRKQLIQTRQENDKLNERCRTQLALLQRNEKAARVLETAAKDSRQRLARKTTELDAALKRLKQIEEESRVVDGLKGSLDDADVNLTATKQKMAAALADLEHARQLQADTARQLADSRSTVKKLEEALASERNRRVPGNDALMEQIKQLTQQLDAERARVSSLQLVLRERDRQEPAVPTPVRRSPSIDVERQTRVRDNRFLVRGYLRQGVDAEKKGKNEAAIWNYKKVLEHDSGNHQALKRLGLIAARNGDDVETIRYLTRAFYADPDDDDTLLALGYALVRERKADMAVSMLARAAALHADNGAVQRSLGVAYSSLGWADAAEAQFRRALALNKKDSEAAFNLAVLLASRRPGELDEARKWYHTAKRLGAQADPGLDALFAARPAPH